MTYIWFILKEDNVGNSWHASKTKRSSSWNILRLDRKHNGPWQKNMHISFFTGTGVKTQIRYLFLKIMWFFDPYKQVRKYATSGRMLWHCTNFIFTILVHKNTSHNNCYYVFDHISITFDSSHSKNDLRSNIA